jgi:hypothetical protein
LETHHYALITFQGFRFISSRGSSKSLFPARRIYSTFHHMDFV